MSGLLSIDELLRVKRERNQYRQALEEIHKLAQAWVDQKLWEVQEIRDIAEKALGKI
jgi:antitoxin component HigA of HigAB toxin-antitoxin module